MRREYHHSSFRDPSGRLFVHNDCLYREVKQIYAKDYDQLINSGLYKQLTEAGQLIPHIEVVVDEPQYKDTYKIIKPNNINFISYPYEWCFSQLKDAALLTLAIQKTAMRFGMTLKDASAYNVQFIGCSPIFIDTLSFESYREGELWVAYRQFCQHFLAPLMLCARKDIRFSRISQLYIDGVPLDLANSVLPWTTSFNPGAFMHLKMHSKFQKKYSSEHNLENKRNAQVDKKSLLGLLDNLESIIRNLEWKPIGTEWADYYSKGKNNYDDSSFSAKKETVSKYLEQIKPKALWDVGANTGSFSRIASSLGINTVSMDIDAAAVELNYIQGQKDCEKNILPLLMDLTNPSAGIGWQNRERMSLVERGPTDMIMALALIHHLAIGNNVPFESIAEFFSMMGKHLIMEFVPIDDSQVKMMLATRKNIFVNYDIAAFKSTFSGHYTIMDEYPLPGSKRTMFLMQKS